MVSQGTLAFVLSVLGASNLVQAAGFPSCSQLTYCARGGNGQNLSKGNIDTLPRCWYQFDNEREFGCYDPLEGSCNNIRDVDMFDTDSCRSDPEPSPKPQPPSRKGKHPTCSQLTRCAHGGKDNHVQDGNINTLPRCWYRRPNEKEFGCFLAVKDSCNDIEGVDMFDTTTCDESPEPQPKPQPKPQPPTPDYRPCPDLTVDVCTSAKTKKRQPTDKTLRYWAWDSDKWVCGTSKKLLKGLKNIVDLHAPPSRCLVKEKSPYTCQ